MSSRIARIYDVVAILVILIVVGLDQWTKALVVEYLSPPGSHPLIPIVSQYLVIDYIQNRGAAFGILANNALLAVLIAVAIVAVCYLYIRMINTAPLAYKIIFGMIIGGAAGNLLDRAHNSGFVVDFISFRIPQINYYFAIFNIADACISVGVFLLFVLVLFGGLHSGNDSAQEHNAAQSRQPHTNSSGPDSGGTLRPTEQDVQP